MSDKRIVILYGSETGNAQDFAHILSHKLKRLHFQHVLTSFGDYTPKDILQCKYLFIICSTTGQGELPRNARENNRGKKTNTLWYFLKKSNLPAKLLDHVTIAMLGLGDSSYPQFNFAIRKLHERMVNQLGAKELFPRLEADELGLAGSNKGTGNGVESVYHEFEKRITHHLMDSYPYRKLNGETIVREVLDEEVYLKPSSRLVEGSTVSSNSEDMMGTLVGLTFEGDKMMKNGMVNENLRITSEDHFQDVRKFVFDPSEDEAYFPGDSVGLYPHNSDEDVDAFLDAQPHWKPHADKNISITNLKQCDLFNDGGLVQPLTLRNLLKYHFDISSIPRQSFFIKIWTFATNSGKLSDGDEQLLQQRTKLRQFAYDEDLQDLYDYCNRPRRSILELVQDFESLELPWEFALDYLPVIKPRFYSISSAPSAKNIELTIAVVKYKTLLRKIRKGLCTNYLKDLQAGDTIRYKIHNNNLLKEELRGKPIILVSPGVGLAPMKCVIQSNFFGEKFLFFGNRHKEKDFLYSDTLTNWNNEGAITLFTCFSRDPQHSPNTKYVQDVMWQQSELLANMILKKDAVTYICGSSGKMPVQVRLTVLEILKKHGNFDTEEDAEVFLKKLERTNRYLQETW